MTGDVSDIVEMPGEAIGLDEVRARIEADAQRLRDRLGDGLSWPSYPAGTPGASPGGEIPDRLRRLAADHDRLYVEPVLTRRNRWYGFAPLAALRRALHGLILFYVNTLASRQVVVNRRILDSLRWLSEARQARANSREVESLHETVQRLEERVARLEERLRQKDG